MTVLCSKLFNCEITKPSLWGFMVKFQVHHLLIGTGSPWRNQVLFLPQLGPRKPLAPDRFLPCSSGRCLPIPSLLALSEDSTCAAGEGIWHAQAPKEKPLCPDVLIPCGNPLHHAWPPTAGLDKVNDCCATEVTYAHWSLQYAHKRGPPPLLAQLNAFYLEICTIYLQFSPHTTKLH